MEVDLKRVGEEWVSMTKTHSQRTLNKKKSTLYYMNFIAK